MSACLWTAYEHDVMSLCLCVLVYVFLFISSVLCTLASVSDETRAIERVVRASQDTSGMVYVYVHPCADDIKRWTRQLEFLFYSKHFAYEREGEFVPGRTGYILYWADVNAKLNFDVAARPMLLSSWVTSQPTLGRLITVMEYMENTMGVKGTRGENWSDTTSNTSKDITCGTA